MTDEELKELIASLAESTRETDRQIQATGRQLEATDRQLKETDLQLKETGRYLEETARKRREENQETDRQIRELKQQIGGLGDKFGSFTEGLALPSMARILSERLNLEVIAPSVRVKQNGHSMEIDVLAFSNFSDDLAVVEVKSHVREESLAQMRRILREFRDFFPVFKDKKIYGILAGVDVPANLQDQVLREGIYLARIHDGQFELAVPESFQPRVF